MEYRKYAGYSRIFRRVFLSVDKFILNGISSRRTQSKTSIGSHADWIPAATKLSKSLHVKKPFDLIISTCLPFEAHQIASILKLKFEIPWIADYRDPFSYSHTVIGSPKSDKIELERATLVNADLCLTTSLGFSRAIRKVYAGKIEIVHNGFNRLEPLRSSKLNNPILISYQGSIYKEFQDIELVLSALDSCYMQLNDMGRNDLPIIFRVGGFSTHMITEYFQQQAKEVPAWIDLIGVTSISETRRMQIDSDFLLMLNWEDKNQAGVMQTKLYEYVSSGTRIIATGGFLDESSDILKISGSCFSFKDTRALRDFLLRIIETDQLEINRDDVGLERFSRRSQAGVIHRLAVDLLETR